MAEKHPDNSRSPERTALVPSTASSAELSTTGSSELQAFSLNRTSSLGHFASCTVPIRLDVLFFLLNSAARGAQNAVPPLPASGGQMSLTPCHAPAAHQSSCCNCCHATGRTQPHGGTNPLGAAQRSYSGQGGLIHGVPGNQNSGHPWPSHIQQGGGKTWPGWNRDQSPMGWRENPRQGGASRGHGNSSGGNWQGRQTNSERSWGDRRQGMGDSVSWKSGPQNLRREASFGSNAGSGQRNQEGSRRQVMWDIPEAKRRSDDARMGRQEKQQSAQGSGEDWEVDYTSKPTASATPRSASHQESQAGTSKICENQRNEDGRSINLPKLEPVTFPPPKLTSKDQGLAPTGKQQFMLPKAIDVGQTKQVAQGSGEDWEVDYKSKPAAAATLGSTSHQEDQAGTSKTCENQRSEDGPSIDPPKLEPLTSPPPKLTSKDQGTAPTGKELGGSHSDWSKNSGFASYLKGLYSDQDKSSSEGSSNLIIDMDICEDEQSPKSGTETDK